jgi:hypothetical protein
MGCATKSSSSDMKSTLSTLFRSCGETEGVEASGILAAMICVWLLKVDSLREGSGTADGLLCVCAVNSRPSRQSQRKSSAIGRQAQRRGGRCKDTKESKEKARTPKDRLRMRRRGVRGRRRR